jgi:hypothetical protein
MFNNLLEHMKLRVRVHYNGLLLFVTDWLVLYKVHIWPKQSCSSCTLFVGSIFRATPWTKTQEMLPDFKKESTLPILVACHGNQWSEEFIRFFYNEPSYQTWSFVSWVFQAFLWKFYMVPNNQYGQQRWDI